MHLTLLIPIAVFALLLKSAAAPQTEIAAPFTTTTEAPHGLGNVYAPDIIQWQGEWLMFFGGQGKDGHDRIHLATSKTGTGWTQHGVVFAPEGVNHVNDPSVVAVDGKLYLFYTLARSGVTDTIGLATSTDGKNWTDLGTVFAPSAPPAWDSLLVGRPSVIHDGNQFRLWYDGRKDLPIGAPDATAPTSENSHRYIGHATSPDGKTWTRRPTPVAGEDAGGIHVLRIRDRWIMVIESREGTRWAESTDGIAWQSKGLLQPKDAAAPYGHVTPFILNHGPTLRLYYGAAKSTTWDQNSIFSTEIEIPLPD